MDTKPDTPIEHRIIEWLLSDDTGSSSKTLCAHMLNMTIEWASTPSDASDRGRCIRLLRLVPEWVPRLNELVAAEPGRPASVNGETDHKYGWREQVPLIISEGGFAEGGGGEIVISTPPTVAEGEV